MLALRLVRGARPAVQFRRLLVAAASAGTGFLLLCTLGYALGHPDTPSAAVLRLVWCAVPLAATVQLAVAVARTDPATRPRQGFSAIGLGPGRLLVLSAVSTAVSCTLGSLVALLFFLHLRGGLTDLPFDGEAAVLLAANQPLPLPGALTLLALVPVLASVAGALVLRPRTVPQPGPAPGGRPPRLGGFGGYGRSTERIGFSTYGRFGTRSSTRPAGHAEDRPEPGQDGPRPDRSGDGGGGGGGTGRGGYAPGRREGRSRTVTDAPRDGRPDRNSPAAERNGAAGASTAQKTPDRRAGQAERGERGTPKGPRVIALDVPRRSGARARTDDYPTAQRRSPGPAGHDAPRPRPQPAAHHPANPAGPADAPRPAARADPDRADSTTDRPARPGPADLSRPAASPRRAAPPGPAGPAASSHPHGREEAAGRHGPAREVPADAAGPADPARQAGPTGPADPTGPYRPTGPDNRRDPHMPAAPPAGAPADRRPYDPSVLSVPVGPTAVVTGNGTPGAAAATPAVPTAPTGLPWGAAVVAVGLAVETYAGQSAPAQGGPRLPGGATTGSPWVLVGWALTAVGLALAGPALTHLSGRLLQVLRPGAPRLLAGRVLMEEAHRIGRPVGTVCAVASGAYAMAVLHTGTRSDAGPLTMLGALVVAGCAVATLLTIAVETRDARADTTAALLRIGAPAKALRTAAALRAAALLLVLTPLTWVVAKLAALPLMP